MDKRDIKLFRAYLELDQKGFAERVGCSISAIMRWETGRFEPMEIYKKRLEELMKENGFDIHQFKRPQKP
jgi:DNA-binding transcriptional regulator YiaG